MLVEMEIETSELEHVRFTLDYARKRDLPMSIIPSKMIAQEAMRKVRRLNRASQRALRIEKSEGCREERYPNAREYQRRAKSYLNVVTAHLFATYPAGWNENTTKTIYLDTPFCLYGSPHLWADESEELRERVAKLVYSRECYLCGILEEAYLDPKDHTGAYESIFYWKRFYWRSVATDILGHPDWEIADARMFGERQMYIRSEERRVGEEGRSRGSPYH